MQPDTLSQHAHNWLDPERPLDASVCLEQTQITATIEDRRADILELFDHLAPAQRDQFALEAWKIGLRALASAQAQSQQIQLKEVGESIIIDLRHHLEQHRPVTARLGGCRHDLT